MIGRLSTLGTYISRPFTNPGTDTSKDNHTSALVGAVSLVVLAGGTYYVVNTIQRNFSPANNANGKILQVKDTVLTKSPSKGSLTEEMIKANAAWGLPPGVKTTLDQLFINSPYSIDTLPFYPVTSSTENIEREQMKAPIMRGTFPQGDRFIVIKADSTLTNENIEKMPTPIQDFFKTNRTLKATILLGQRYVDGPITQGDGKFAWIQLNGSSCISPKFFTQNFTYPDDGSGPTASQQEDFKLLQTLIRTGSGQDRQGVDWIIPKE